MSAPLSILPGCLDVGSSNDVAVLCEAKRESDFWKSPSWESVDITESSRPIGGSTKTSEGRHKVWDRTTEHEASKRQQSRTENVPDKLRQAAREYEALQREVSELRSIITRGNTISSFNGESVLATSNANNTSPPSGSAPRHTLSKHSFHVPSSGSSNPPLALVSSFHSPDIPAPAHTLSITSAQRKPKSSQLTVLPQFKKDANQRLLGFFGEIGQAAMRTTVQRLSKTGDHLIATESEPEASDDLDAWLELQREMPAASGAYGQQDSLQVHNGWYEDTNGKKKQLLKGNTGMHHTKDLHLQHSLSKAEENHTRCNNVVLNPDAPTRALWDFVGLVTLVYDIVTVPLLLGFSLEPTEFLRTCNLLIASFWTLDMLLSAFTAYYSRGNLVTSLKRVLWNYICTWMLFDMTLVVVNWYALEREERQRSAKSNEQTMGQSIRGLKAIRALRLLRAVKLRRAFLALERHITSQAFGVYVTITLQLLALIIALHVVACAWFAIGLEADNGWVHASSLAHRETLEQYSHSLFWAITQVQGSTEVFPSTSGERFFNIIALFFAIITVSSLLGSLTNAMIQLGKLVSQETNALWQLRRFLRQRKINRTLAKRIEKHLEHEYQRTQGSVKEDEVAILSLLSENLQAALQMASMKEYIVPHPLFELMWTTDAELMNLCVDAFIIISRADNDTIFLPGQEGNAAWLVISGSLIYSTEIMGDMVTYNLYEEDWASEVSLWTHWYHQGAMVAAEESQVVSIASSKFRDAVSKHAYMFQIVVKYMRDFLRAAKNDDSPHDLINGINLFGSRKQPTVVSLLKQRYTKMVN